MHFYVERDLQPQKYFPANPDGSVHKFDDLPAGYPVNIDRDPPLDRDPGAAPALTESEIDDVIAFLQTLTDGDVGGGAEAAGSAVARTGAAGYARVSEATP
jgi:cytochrome c peroxidase